MEIVKGWNPQSVGDRDELKTKREFDLTVDYTSYGRESVTKKYYTGANHVGCKKDTGILKQCIEINPFPWPDDTLPGVIQGDNMTELVLTFRLVEDDSGSNIIGKDDLVFKDQVVTIDLTELAFGVDQPFGFSITSGGATGTEFQLFASLADSTTTTTTKTTLVTTTSTTTTTTTTTQTATSTTSTTSTASTTTALSTAGPSGTPTVDTTRAKETATPAATPIGADAGSKSNTANTTLPSTTGAGGSDPAAGQPPAVDGNSSNRSSSAAAGAHPPPKLAIHYIVLIVLLVVTALLLLAYGCIWYTGKRDQQRRLNTNQPVMTNPAYAGGRMGDAAAYIEPPSPGPSNSTTSLPRRNTQTLYAIPVQDDSAAAASASGGSRGELKPDQVVYVSTPNEHDPVYAAAAATKQAAKAALYTIIKQPKQGTSQPLYRPVYEASGALVDQLKQGTSQPLYRPVYEASGALGAGVHAAASTAKAPSAHEITYSTYSPSGNGGDGSGDYYDADHYDADHVAGAKSAAYATPLDGDVNQEPSNQPTLVQVYGDDNGYDSDADGYGGTAA